LGVPLSAPAADAAIEEVFSIDEYRVLGVTALPAPQVERAVYEFSGPGKTVADVEQARQSLERAYRDAGYGTVFVDIPEQTIAAGIVRLQVTEGKLDRVRITGARYTSAADLRERLHVLERGALLHLPTVRDQLAAAARDVPGRSVTPVLKSGRSPGTLDMELKVEDHLPVDASFEVNNRYTADTTETRVGITAGYNNLFQRGHSLSVQGQFAPEQMEDSRVLAATYLARFRDSDNVLAVYVVDTDSEIATLSALSVLGRGRIYGTRFISPMKTSGTWAHTMTYGLDYKDFLEDIRAGTAPGQQTPISYLHGSTGWSTIHRTDNSTSALGLNAGFGLRRVFNSSEEFEARRLHAQPGYFYLRLNGQHEHLIFGGLRLFGRLTTQLADQPLIPNEQFSIGGADTVRGYLESEALGDYGFASTLELRSPSWPLWPAAKSTRFSVYGFADAGIVGLVSPLGQARRVDLSSVGLGTRVGGDEGMSAVLDFAWPLVPGSRTQAEDSRLHFNLRYDF
ncbi:MAG TPA: ShlB/FhaC/HecB family hemolysin secretion/activation protein, partial [Steroidobacteraceae bacterium]|nr:ShlB/FhaC/HecB family hemolysin secretion/activation protein [Steroidobacteraceae bacterium]